MRGGRYEGNCRRANPKVRYEGKAAVPRKIFTD